MSVRICISLFLLLAFACSPSEAPRTELVVVVDSDLAVPDELDEIIVTARGPGAAEREASARLGAEFPPLPRSLALAHEAGPLGPLQITVEGRKDGVTLLSREAEISFVAQRSLVLPMHLVRGCVGTQCEAEETCTERGCESSLIDESALREWTGVKPSLPEPASAEAPEAKDAAAASEGDSGEPNPGEAGDEDGSHAGPRDSGGVLAEDAGVEPNAPDAAEPNAPDAAAQEAGVTEPDASAAADSGPMCAPVQESCNGRDDDCDGVVDDGFDLQSDVNHCGSCGNVCNTRRGDVCCNGVCTRLCTLPWLPGFP